MSTDVPRGYRRVGENRYREVIGRGLSDFTVGQIIEHRPARTITETDHVQILAQTGNPAPVHSDIEFCRQIGHEQVLVCGLLTLNVVMGLTVRHTSALTTGNLALDEVRFELPVHVGDTLHAQSEILTARRSRSRPENGVVTCRITAFNQRDIRVLSCTRTFLVPADADAVREAAQY